MLRLLFLCIAPIFAALPVIGEAHSVDVSGSNAANEEILGSFSLVGDSLKTQFRLQITIENCNKLKDPHGNTLALTALKLKYPKFPTSGYETINLQSANCIHNIEFYNDVQEVYKIELWASWDKQRATAGTFKGRASFNVLPKP